MTQTDAAQKEVASMAYSGEIPAVIRGALFRTLGYATLAVSLALSATAPLAAPVDLAALASSGGTLTRGNLRFSAFTTDWGPGEATVEGITVSGRPGLQFIESVAAQPTGGSADAFVSYKVTVLDLFYALKGFTLSNAFSGTIGSGGLGGTGINVFNSGVLRGTAEAHLSSGPRVASGMLAPPLSSADVVTVSIGSGPFSAGALTVENTFGLTFIGSPPGVVGGSPATPILPGTTTPPSGPGVGPTFGFVIDFSGPTVFVDPIVAIGYDYIASKNFGSVLLPRGIGDNLFELLTWNGGDFVHAADLEGGTPYFFGIGVDRFRILGIEPTAGLDPADPTAFVTGLTFAAPDTVNLTMTALTAFVPGTSVPEPSVLSLLGIAFAGLGWASRRRIS